jgi:Ca2+-transporting ATPase
MVIRPIHTVVPGRGRFHVAGLYRSEPLRRRLDAKLMAHEFVCSVAANVLTGNVLVFFDPARSPSEIVSLIAEVVGEYQDKEARRQGADSTEEGAPGSRVRMASVLSSPRAVGRLLSRAEEQQQVVWHCLSADAVATMLHTSTADGLSDAAVAEALRKYGPNIFPEAVPRSGLAIFVGQLTSFPVALLGVAAAFSLFTGGLADALAIAAVILINAGIGYTTESQAETVMHSLQRLARPSALVVRNSMVVEVPAEAIAVGDVLVLRPGSYVVADARLVEAQRLSVDESVLTGESLPSAKMPAPLERADTPLADRRNMLYRGTLVTGGQGVAVVVATGRFTQMGRIQAMVGEASPPATPMERQLGEVSRQLALTGSLVCGLVFGIGLLRGYGVTQMLKTSISLAVAVIPEGLPAVATTTLAFGMRRLRSRHALMRHLEAVETLGAVQTICLDKTGTLTLNRMSVVAVHVGMRHARVADGTFQADDMWLNPYTCDELLRLLHVSVLCNEAEVVRAGENGYVVKGSATESALLHVAISVGVDVIQLRAQHPLVEMTQRAEQRNFMSSVHRLNPHGRLVAVKGSPPEILDMCRWYLKGGMRLPLSDEDRLRIQTANERMAGEALRVLGAAYSHAEGDASEAIRDGLIWLGLVGMIDPIRPGAQEVIETFHRAGIDTVMITGDQSQTAYAIGRALNLGRDGRLEILDSTHLSQLDAGMMQALSTRVQIFARVSPAHKLQIVQALQRAGRVVAMTGDGINDGPALKAADIGVAMGDAGTDVAREVADMILEDDSLETMIVAIGEGRRIYNNIRKSVHFLLSTNASEILVMFTALAGGLGQPLNALQLLWINLITDIAPALALALEPAEPDVLSRPPRNPDESIIRATDLKRIVLESAVLSAGTLGAYGCGLARYGLGPQAGTLAFMTLTGAQLLHALSCRSDHRTVLSRSEVPANRALDLALLGSLGLQALTLILPGLRGLLGTATIDVLDGLVSAGVYYYPSRSTRARKPPPRCGSVSRPARMCRSTMRND